MSTIWIILGFLALMLAAAPWLMEARRKPIDSAARAAAPGQFIELTDGVTHYQWHGTSVRGPVMICVHGLTTPSYVWEPIARRLAAMGFRVLTYDLFGRGYSDRPKAEQTRAFFLRQLEELLESQNVERDFTLMGYSMGGSIATCFAARHPERPERLVLVATAGLSVAKSRFTEFCRTTPIAGDWLMVVLGGIALRHALEQARRATPERAYMIDCQKAELRTRGYLRSILSSLRHMLNENLRREHRLLARAGLPILALWGESDRVIRPNAPGRLALINRAAHQLTVQGADHALPYTHSDAVVEALIDRIRES